MQIYDWWFRYALYVNFLHITIIKKGIYKINKVITEVRFVKGEATYRAMLDAALNI